MGTTGTLDTVTIGSHVVNGRRFNVMRTTVTATGTVSYRVDDALTGLGLTLEPLGAEPDAAGVAAIVAALADDVTNGTLDDAWFNDDRVAITNIVAPAQTLTLNGSTIEYQPDVLAAALTDAQVAALQEALRARRSASSDYVMVHAVVTTLESSPDIRVYGSEAEAHRAAVAVAEDLWPSVTEGEKMPAREAGNGRASDPDGWNIVEELREHFGMEDDLTVTTFTASSDLLRDLLAQ